MIPSNSVRSNQRPYLDYVARHFFTISFQGVCPCICLLHPRLLYFLMWPITATYDGHPVDMPKIGPITLSSLLNFLNDIMTSTLVLILTELYWYLLVTPFILHKQLISNANNNSFLASFSVQAQSSSKEHWVPLLHSNFRLPTYLVEFPHAHSSGFALLHRYSRSLFS